MFSKICSIVFVCVICSWDVLGQLDDTLPSDIPVCKRDDPDLNTCAISVITEWTVRFRDGIESLNIPPTDPLKIGRANFVFNNGIIRGVISLRNAKIYGISEMQPSNVSVQLNDPEVTLEEEVFLPKLKITGRYRGEVEVLGLNVKPNGYLDINLTNLTLFAMFKCHSTVRPNGYTYVHIDSLKTTATTDKMYLNMTGVSPDAELNNAFVEFVNKNSKQIFDGLIDNTLDIFSPYIVNIYNTFVDQVPLIKN